MRNKRLSDLKNMVFCAAFMLRVFVIIFGCRAKTAEKDEGWIEPLKGIDLSAFRQPTDRWQFVGDAFLDPADETKIATSPGTGVLAGTGGIPNIFTELEHGDVEAHIEFMVPKGSNSGVYFMGRYEIQVLDSWGVEKPQHSDCGGIYQRWDESRQGDPGFDGIPPRVNASRKPGEWQSYDVIFHAPRFDSSGKKIANAKFVKVIHNGVVIHENDEATGPTRAAAFNDEIPTGPLMLQGDHGPVAYRNIQIRHLNSQGQLSGDINIDQKPYQALLKYDFGQDRAGLISIEEQIRKATPQQLPVIEGKLLVVLESKDASFAAKQFVCRMLQRAGTSESVPSLSKLLTDEKLSHMARFALQSMPYPQVDKALRDAMDKADGKTKIGIISTIAVREDKEAVNQLSKLVQSDDSNITKAAINALGWIGGEKAAEILTDAKVPAELEIVRQDSLINSADKMFAEGNKSKALNIYRQMTGADKTTSIRIAAYRGLVTAEKEKAVPIILSLLEDTNPKIRAAAGMLIAEAQGKEATKAFAEKLSSLPAGSQVMLLSSLAARGDKSAAGQVAAAVKSDNEAVRIAAISALGALGGISDIELLAQQSIAPGQVGKAASRSLAVISGEGVSDGLLKAAQSGNAEVRANLIDCLVTRQQKDAVPVLIKLAEDKNSSVRKASFKALGSLAERQDIAVIVSLLIKNTSSSERRDLEQSLVSVTGRFEDKKSSIDVIIAGLNEADDTAKVNLLSVLSKLGGEEAYKTVCGCLKSDNTDVRKGAIRALSDWPDAAPVANLLDIAKNDTDNTSAILALRGYIRLVSLPSERFNRQTIDLLKGAFKLAKTPDEKKAVLNVLPNFACPEALELAKSALNDNNTSAEAEIAVQKLESMSLIAAASKVSTSGGTNIHMINDQIIPKGPDDAMVSFHWWPKSGTREWVQYDFGDKHKISAVEIYWFDDTGRGSCRVPQSWQILYRENGEFKPVNNASGYGVERDKFNKTTFEPVETDALRLEVQLQSNESCGIHEWRVE